MYIILPSPQFSRLYQKLDPELQQRIDKQLQILRENPHHPSLRTHKRRGEEDIWQARMTRDYRLLFMMEGETITLLFVGPHEK